MTQETKEAKQLTAKVQAVDIRAAKVEVAGKSNILKNEQMIEVIRNLLDNGIDVQVEVNGFIRMGASLKSELLEMSDISEREQAKLMAGSMKATLFTIKATGGN
jgi:hypothetical protein